MTMAGPRRLVVTDYREWAEKDLLANVVEMGKVHGWVAVHFGGNLHGRAWYDAAGFPDLLLLHAGRRLIWFRELKSIRGQLTDRQKAWYDTLAKGGWNVDVWRPSDWPDIVTCLSFGQAKVA
jgi:hypothetical protein